MKNDITSIDRTGIQCALCGLRDIFEAREEACISDGGVIISKRCGFARRRVLVREKGVEVVEEDCWKEWHPRLREVWMGGVVAKASWGRAKDALVDCGRILDVGAECGELVYLLRRLGKNALGLESNARRAGWAREALGMPVMTGDWKTAEFGEASLDAVTAFWILDKAEDPLEAMRRFWFWLRKGGTLVVEVPDLEARGWRSRGSESCYFNEVSLGMLGKKAGFSVERTEKVPAEGSVVVVFQKDGKGESMAIEADGNCERVLKVFRGKTWWHRAVLPILLRKWRGAWMGFAGWWAAWRKQMKMDYYENPGDGAASLLEDVFRK